MIFDASNFVFKPPAILSRARRVLINPNASYPAPYPVSTSPEIISSVISGIRQISDADILILAGTPDGGPVFNMYRALGYNFPRILMLDVRDCIMVEVDNPLPKPLVVPTFWVPNVILSCDFLITLAPLKVIAGKAHLSIMNLLTLLPSVKYGNGPAGWASLYSLGIEKVITDLYFTLPFDLGIIEARQKLISSGDPASGEIEPCGKIFVGAPYEVDCEASQTLGLTTSYLDLIREARVEFET